MRFKVLFMSLVLISLSGPVVASDRDDQVWSSLKISSGFKDDFKMLGEVINRYSQDSERFVTRSVRLGVSYDFESAWTYALILENRTASSDASDEIRWIHQFSHKMKFEPVDVGLRFRWEQREFSDTSSFSNRLRARVQLDGKAYQWGPFTPFVLSEYFYAANEVPGRPKGATELRLQGGVSFLALGGKVGVSYMDRRVVTPAYQGAPRDTSDYSILDLSLSWSY